MVPIVSNHTTPGITCQYQAAVGTLQLAGAGVNFFRGVLLAPAVCSVNALQVTPSKYIFLVLRWGGVAPVVRV